MDQPVFVASVEEESRVVEIYERSDWSPEQQYVDVTYRYDIREKQGGARRVEYSIPQRYLSSDQLRALAAQAGLEVIDLSFGFGAESEDPESSQMVLSARRPRPR